MKPEGHPALNNVCFLDVATGAPTHFDQRRHVSGRQTKRLFAENVLSGFHRSHAPLEMQIIRQRYVDCFDLRVVEQRLKMRDDVVTDGGQANALMANAPEGEDHFFVVPKVVE